MLVVLEANGDGDGGMSICEAASMKIHVGVA
jgi:hypothetical protein